MQSHAGQQDRGQPGEIREAFEAWQNGTGSITDVFAPEMIWRIEGHSAASKEYENSYAWFMKMNDGEVIDGTAFYDSISFNDLWNRVQPCECRA